MGLKIFFYATAFPHTAVELTVLVLLGQNVTLDCSEYENPAVLWAVDGVFIHPLVEYPGVQIHAIDPDLLTFAMTNFSANETEFSCSKTHWKILIAGEFGVYIKFNDKEGVLRVFC